MQTIVEIPKTEEEIRRVWGMTKPTEQEPCELHEGDLISRSEALKLFTWTNTKEDIWYGLKQLPSVAIPSVEPKTGHWIMTSESSARCSCCYKHNLFYGDFCKWCGAKERSEE